MSEASRPPDLPEPSEYRFSEAHRDMFRTLAQSMSFVGVSLLLLSLLGGSIFGLVALSEGFVANGVAVLVAAVALVLMAWWMMSAGRSLGALVRTQGRDVHRLMEAVTQLRLLFGFARVVVIVFTLLVTLIAAGVLWCMLVGQAGTKCFGAFG
jgi:hypothetical protein